MLASTSTTLWQEAVCLLHALLSVTYESMSGYQRREMDGVSGLCQILSSLSLGFVASLNWVIEVMTRHGYPRSRLADRSTSLNSMTQHNQGWVFIDVTTYNAKNVFWHYRLPHINVKHVRDILILIHTDLQLPLNIRDKKNVLILENFSLCLCCSLIKRKGETRKRATPTEM